MTDPAEITARLQVIHDALQRRINGHILRLYTLYDVAKVLPHPYDAFKEQANGLLHDFNGLASSINSYLAVSLSELVKSRERVAVLEAQNREALADAWDKGNRANRYHPPTNPFRALGGEETK